MWTTSKPRTTSRGDVYWDGPKGLLLQRHFLTAICYMMRLANVMVLPIQVAVDNIDADLFGKENRNAMFQPSDAQVHKIRTATYAIVQAAYAEALVRYGFFCPSCWHHLVFCSYVYNTALHQIYMCMTGKHVLPWGHQVGTGGSLPWFGRERIRALMLVCKCRIVGRFGVWKSAERITLCSNM